MSGPEPTGLGRTGSRCAAAARPTVCKGSKRTDVSPKTRAAFSGLKRGVAAGCEAGPRGHRGPRSDDDDDVKDPCAACIAADTTGTDKGRGRGDRKGAGVRKSGSLRVGSLHSGVGRGARIGVGKAGWA